MGETLLEVLDVHKVFPRKGAEVVALAGVNFSVERGDFLAVMGPSGSGKSTLLHLLGCLDAPSAGRILFGGRDLGSLDDRAASRLRNERVGFLFQSFHLIPQMDLVENVETALLYSRRAESEWRPRALALLSELGLTDRAHHRPGEVSGGEAQRAALARALVNDPDLILADEPTGNLDSRTGEQVLGLLESLVARGKTLVLVTHDAAIAARARQRLTLRDGRVVSRD
jgi:putative ABC transport system ATP-binding protein